MKKILSLVISLLVLTASCSDGNDLGTGNQDVQKIEKQIVGKSWVANIVNSIPNVEVLCQYDLHEDHTALCQLMSVEEIDGAWRYTLDSVNVKWDLVANYDGYEMAHQHGAALRIVADTTETYMIIKSVTDEKMVCVLASGERSEELVFDKILTPLDVDDANRKLDSYINAQPDKRKYFSSSYKNWMKDVNDTVKVCNMSIPGTHDATTYNVAEAISFGARCQDLNLSQQWDAGVRVFDLRIRQGYLYHDFIPCNMNLAYAFNTILSKVQQYKDTDGAIIICKTEGNHFANSVGIFSGALSWVIDFITGVGVQFSKENLDEFKTVNNLAAFVGRDIVEKGLMAEFKPDMTMKDLRGKILIINRNDLSAEGCYGPLASGWGGDETLTTADGTQTKLYVQDEYEPAKNESDGDYTKRKKKVFKETWDKSQSLGDNTWVVNQASGYIYDLAFPNYAILAEDAYPSMIDAVKNFHGKGLILQDYAGVDKTCRISAKVTAPLAITALAVPKWFGCARKLWRVYFRSPRSA